MNIKIATLFFSAQGGYVYIEIATIFQANMYKEYSLNLTASQYWAVIGPMLCIICVDLILDRNPVKKKRWPSIGLIMGHRLRRRLIIKPMLSQGFVFFWESVQIMPPYHAKPNGRSSSLEKSAVTAFWLCRKNCSGPWKDNGRQKVIIQ